MTTKQYAALLYILITSILIQVKSHAQTLVSDTLIESKSQSQLSEMIPMIQHGADAHKIQYLTQDINGQESIASGLIVVPSSNSCSWSLTSYLHGTVTKKEDVPSRLNSEATIGYYAAAIIGSVVALPDYLGLGDSPGFHPYIHSKTEASASLDMLRATKEFCEKHSIYLNDDLFLFGYSQGGHSTLALQKLIEEEASEEFKIKYSIPMSGPYDLSGVQTEMFTGRGDYPSPFYLPYLVLSYHSLYPELNKYDLDSLFISPYDSLLPIYFDGYHDSDQIDLIMPNNPVEIFNPDFYNEFLSDSLDHPFRLALADNDLTNWYPESPVNFYYCNGDQHVTYLNSIIASEAMNNMQGTTIEATEINPTFDHGECVLPSLTQAILSFLLQSEQCNTSLTENSPLENNISPNPSSNNFSINSHIHDVLTILSLNGQVLLNTIIKPGVNTIDVSDFTPGLYFVKSGKNTQKLVVY